MKHINIKLIIGIIVLWFTVNTFTMINMSDYYYGEYNQEEREEEYQAYIKYQNWKAEHGEEYGIY